MAPSPSSTPILGFNQSDTYFEQLPDGAYLLILHSSHDLPLGIHDENQPTLVLDAKGGIEGDVIATEVVRSSTYLLSLGAGGGVKT